MVESSGLLNRRSVKNATGGSNPPLSASNCEPSLLDQVYAYRNLKAIIASVRVRSHPAVALLDLR